MFVKFISLSFIFLNFFLQGSNYRRLCKGDLGAPLFRDNILYGIYRDQMHIEAFKCGMYFE